MAKCHVRESMNSYVVFVLFVLMKDGSWRIFIDYRAINKIIIKYCHNILKLDDILDELNGVRGFIKLT